MKLTIVLAVIVAMLLLFAIYLRENVKFTVRFLGTDLSLEVKDQRARRTESLTPGHTNGDIARREGEPTSTPSQPE